MTLRMRDDEVTREGLRHIRRMPIGAERLARYLKEVKKDVAKFSLEEGKPPAPIAAAYARYSEAIEQAHRVVAEVDKSKAAEAKAADSDVQEAADAMRSGKRPWPHLTLPGKRLDTQTIEVACRGAEQFLEEVHGELVDAIRANWVAWRDELEEARQKAEKAGIDAAKKATQAIEILRTKSEAIRRLDGEIKSRYPDVAAVLDKEERGGLPWYATTHTYRSPLDGIVIPDLTGLEFPPAEWVPPEDPRHEDLRREAFDHSLPWVAKAIARAYGTVCHICRRPGATVLVESPRGRVVVHPACESKTLTEREIRDREYQDRRGQRLRNAEYGEDLQPSWDGRP